MRVMANCKQSRGQGFLLLAAAVSVFTIAAEAAPHLRLRPYVWTSVVTSMPIRVNIKRNTYDAINDE
jgi:hypothetical protein